MVEMIVSGIILFLLKSPGPYKFPHLTIPTFKLNTFLNKICINKNIHIIEDNIKDVVKNDLGNIKHLIGQKQNYTADLFIDCSGFTGFLLKKVADFDVFTSH